jgi:LysR family hydrogen peroxide-inducible transcriptional activator
MTVQTEELQIHIEEFKTEELIVALAENKVDIGILAGPYHASGMRTVPLFVEEILIYFPELKKQVITPVDIEEVQPWLLSEGNCLRTQMVHFCKIEGQTGFDDVRWSYQGGNIDLLLDMVDLNGGYTLVPEFYKTHKKKLRRLWDDATNEFPAREVIAVFPNKTYKKEAVEKIIRTIQLKYGQKSQGNLKVLNWK